MKNTFNPAQIFYRLLALAFLLLPTAAHAKGFYIIGAFGPTRQYHFDAFGETRLDEGRGFMWGFGKEFGENQAIEFFIADPGTMRLKGDGDDTFEAAGGVFYFCANPAFCAEENVVETSADTFGAAFKWHRDYSKSTGGFLKLGLHSWEAELKHDGIVVDTEEGTDWLFGLGIEYKVNDNLALIVDYDIYQYFTAFRHFNIGIKLSF